MTEQERRIMIDELKKTQGLKPSEYDKLLETMEDMREDSRDERKTVKLIHGTLEFIGKSLKDGFDAWRSIDDATSKFGRKAGMSSGQIEAYRKTYLQTYGDLSRELAMKHEEIARVQQEFINASGKNIALTKDQLRSMGAMTKLTSPETVRAMTEGMNRFGVSSSRAMGVLGLTMAKARTSGLDAEKATASVAKNLNLASKLNFKGGLNDLTDMVRLSQEMGVNLESLGGAVEKFENLEGALDTGAQLQVLGGSIGANFNDLNMFALAQTDAASAMEKLTESLQGYVHFDADKGFNADPVSRRILKEFGNKLGMSFDEVFSMASRNAQLDEYRKQNTNLNEDELRKVANLVNYDAAKRQFNVSWFDENTHEQRTTELKDITSAQLKTILGHQDEQQLLRLDVHKIYEKLSQYYDNEALKSSSLDEVLDGFKSSWATMLASILEVPMNFLKGIFGELAGLSGLMGSGATLGVAIGSAVVGGRALTNVTRASRTLWKKVTRKATPRAVPEGGGTPPPTPPAEPPAAGIELEEAFRYDSSRKYNKAVAKARDELKRYIKKAPRDYDGIASRKRILEALEAERDAFNARNTQIRPKVFERPTNRVNEVLDNKLSTRVAKSRISGRAVGGLAGMGLAMLALNAYENGQQVKEGPNAYSNLSLANNGLTNTVMAGAYSMPLMQQSGIKPLQAIGAAMERGQVKGATQWAKMGLMREGGKKVGMKSAAALAPIKAVKGANIAGWAGLGLDLANIGMKSTGLYEEGSTADKLMNIGADAATWAGIGGMIAGPVGMAVGAIGGAVVGTIDQYGGAFKAFLVGNEELNEKNKQIADAQMEWEKQKWGETNIADPQLLQKAAVATIQIHDLMASQQNIKEGKFASGEEKDGGLWGDIKAGFKDMFGFAEGGIVPSTPSSTEGKDSVPAMLTPGELVVPRQKVATVLGGGQIQHFADGGIVQAQPIGQKAFIAPVGVSVPTPNIPSSTSINVKFSPIEIKLSGNQGSVDLRNLARELERNEEFKRMFLDSVMKGYNNAGNQGRNNKNADNYFNRGDKINAMNGR